MDPDERRFQELLQIDAEILMREGELSMTIRKEKKAKIQDKIDTLLDRRISLTNPPPGDSA